MARQGRRTVLVRMVFLMAGDDMRRAVAGIRHDWSARAGCPGVIARRSRARSWRRTRHRRRVHPGERAPRTKRPNCSLAHSDDGDWNRDRHGYGRRALLFSETGLDSGWWRIAFLLAFPLGFIGVQLRRRVAETSQFEALRTDSRLVDHLARELWTYHRSAVLGGFCLIAAGSLAFNTFFIFMQSHLSPRG